MKLIEISSLLDALPVLLVALAFACIGLWMILFPEDARRFMNRSLEKNDAFFNRKVSKPTPSFLPSALGAVFVIVPLGLTAVLVWSTLG